MKGQSVHCKWISIAVLTLFSYYYKHILWKKILENREKQKNKIKKKTPKTFTCFSEGVLVLYHSYCCFLLFSQLKNISRTSFHVIKYDLIRSQYGSTINYFSIVSNLGLGSLPFFTAVNSALINIFVTECWFAHLWWLKPLK